MAALFADVQRRPAVIRVLDADPELGRVLPRTELDRATRAARARLVTLDPGSWRPRTGGDLPGALGLLVLDGVVSRSVAVNGRSCAELLGAGDLLRPWDLPDTPEPFAGPCSWRVLQPATLAVLDERFATLAGRWPSIIAALLARSTRRARWLALHLAIAHVRQAEARLLMLFWQLAGRWGRMTPGGVALPLPLTHALLADLVCLHRPTTSTALQRLTRAGEIARRRDRGWMLLGEPSSLRCPPPRR